MMPMPPAAGPVAMAAMVDMRDTYYRAVASMPRVELLFFPGCPHVEAARTQLRRALEATGLPASWEEHDETDGYGSPTILVNGVDVLGAPRGDGASCRLYLASEIPGAPPLEALIRALTSMTSLPRGAEGGEEG